MIRPALFSASFLAAALVAGAVHANPAQPSSGCRAKVDEIQAELDAARAQNNARKVTGLEKALAAASTNCTDAGLKAERDEAVREKQEKVRERQEELREERAEGDQEDIARAEQKLMDAEAELAEARREQALP